MDGRPRRSAGAGQQGHAGPRRQRGAVAVLAALAVAAGLVALALAIDVGRLYSAQRDLQRVANLAALDAARVSGGCLGEPDDPGLAAYNETLGSIERNDGHRHSIAPVAVELGREVRAGGKRVFEAVPGRSRQAVRVVLRRPAPTRLLPLAPAAPQLVASAAAQSRPYASVHVGSRLIDLHPDLNGILPAAFGGASPGLSGPSYRSLFEASVPVDTIIDGIGDETPDSVDRRPLSVAELLHRLADALAAAGNDAAAAAAQAIADASDSSAQLMPEQIVAVERDAAAALGRAPVGAGDLTLLAAQTAAEQQGALIDLIVTLPPPLGDSSVVLRILDPGQIAPLTPGSGGEGEPEFASNTQALVQANLVAPSTALGRPLQLPVWVEVAQATARVTDIECARHGQPQDIVRVDARSSISRVGVGRFNNLGAPAPVPQPATLVDVNLPAGLLGIPVPVRVRVTGSAFVDLPGDERSLDFAGPYPQSQAIGRTNVLALYDAVAQLPMNLALDVDIAPLGGLGAVSGALLASARQTLQQALRAEVADALALASDPLADALARAGLTVGGADITVYGVVAKEPYLFTR
ncbi:pilus assembly protein TadG-related protein [Fontimonas sp. SYSU GA230001]|uniref:pilus assembly protein TadG-related protein n=1 Tax=Fontimonas sp. SYSU GA230001 TaxID=3142450 RepID=UPI0032B47BE4